MPGLSKLLFGVAESQVRRMVRAEFNQSAVGQMARSMRSITRGGGAAKTADIQRLFRSRGTSRAAKSSQLGVIADAVQKLQGGGGVAGTELLNSMIDLLGPFGQLFKLLVLPPRGGALESELQTAKAFLEAYGFDVKRPTTLGGRPSTGTLDATSELLSSVGVQLPSPTLPPTEPKDFAPEQRTEAELNLAPAPTRVKMTSVSSSNVHSVGFDAVEGQLYVTYLGGTGKARAGPGPTYRYDLGAGKPGEIQAEDPIEAQLAGRREPTVGAGIFNRILTASSTGGAVWDELRVRGTAFGHQFPYEIVQLGPANTVPRQATPVGFRPRTVRQNGILQASQLTGTGLFRGLRASQTSRSSARARPAQEFGVVRGSL